MGMIRIDTLTKEVILNIPLSFPISVFPAYYLVIVNGSSPNYDVTATEVFTVKVSKNVFGYSEINTAPYFA